MAKLTLTDRYVRGLRNIGMVELERTSKYRVFDGGTMSFPKRRYYVGERGALRVSYNGKVSDSSDTTIDFKNGVFLKSYTKGGQSA